jgi:GNAT superfamily N-acetyltransferase
LKTKLSQIEKLAEEHDASHFDCRKASLNDWLRRFGLVNQRNNSAQTYVVHRRGAVVGFYSLAAGSINREASPERIVKGLARHPIPVILFARLAIDRSTQGIGLGKALLKDALARAEGASDIIGARAILVHTLDDEACSFYKRFGFERCPTGERQLMLLMKDLRASLGSGKPARG